MSKNVPRTCRTVTTGDGRCIRFQCGNAHCKAANCLLNICDLCIIRSHCHSGRNVCTQFSNLDVLYVSSGYLTICKNISLIFSSIVQTRNIVPSIKSGREPSREPILEEQAGTRDTGTSVPSLARESTKLGCRHSDETKNGKLVKHVWTRNDLSQSVHGCSTSLTFYCCIFRFNQRILRWRC